MTSPLRHPHDERAWTLIEDRWEAFVALGRGVKRRGRWWVVGGVL